MTASVPDSDATAYMSSVILLYVELPETPLSASLQDHRQARRLHDRGVPLQIVEVGSAAGFAAPVGQTRGSAAVNANSLAGLLPAGHRRTPRPSHARSVSGISAPQTEPNRGAVRFAGPEKYVFR